ncbi:MAG: hypothetical protein RLZZ612_2334 [Pseudomonadota bacterium]|jgi:hypothetical protein
MTYVLEKLTPKYIEKIREDLNTYEKKGKATTVGYLADVPEIYASLAINKAKNNYLIRLPSFSDRGLELMYYFFYNKCWYELKLNFIYDDEIVFIDPEPSEKEEKKEFRENLKIAFSVLGRFGRINKHEVDDLICPIFKEALLHK